MRSEWVNDMPSGMGELNKFNAWLKKFLPDEKDSTIHELLLAFVAIAKQHQNRYSGPHILKSWQVAIEEKVGHKKFLATEEF